MIMTALCISKDSSTVTLMDSALQTIKIYKTKVTKALDDGQINVVNAIKKGNGYTFIDVSGEYAYNICENWARHLAKYTCDKYKEYKFIGKTDNASDTTSFVLSDNIHVLEIAHNQIVTYNQPNYTNEQYKRIEENKNVGYRCFAFLDTDFIDNVVKELRN